MIVYDNATMIGANVKVLMDQRGNRYYRGDDGDWTRREPITVEELLLLLGTVVAGCSMCAKAPAAAGACCSSHRAALCHLCYRRSHFVEVCAEDCGRCAAEGLPPTGLFAYIAANPR